MSAQSAYSEAVLNNGVKTNARLTIAIPTYKDMPDKLIDKLMSCPGAEQSHLLIYDDGSGVAQLGTFCAAAVTNWPGPATLISARENKGRAHARNRLIAHAKTNWILLLDADMLPDSSDFLANYLDAISASNGPSLIAGGFSLKQVTPNRAQSLHARQSLSSECLSAKDRSKDPGRYVFTSNILIHRQILNAVKFDDGFEGWGWEDVDWGLRVARSYPVVHVENTATHLGLDDVGTLLEKYGGSGGNFARMLARHPQATSAMALTKAARTLARLPGRFVIRAAAKLIAKTPAPMSLRLQALKLYRAASYAEHLK